MGKHRSCFIFSSRSHTLTSFLPFTILATMSWIMPRLLLSIDMEVRRVSIASWLVFPSSDSPFTAINWSFTLKRPSWQHRVVTWFWYDYKWYNLLLLLSAKIPKKVSAQFRKMILALQAAPPLMMDLTKMPRSAWFSFERLPFTLTPNPAEPESFSGISKVMNSRVPSGVSTKSSSSAFYSGGETDGRKDKCLKHNIPLEKHLKMHFGLRTPQSTLSMTEKKNVPEGTIVHTSCGVTTNYSGGC